MPKYASSVWKDNDFIVIDVSEEDGGMSYSQDYYPEIVDTVEEEALTMLEWVRVVRELESQGKL